MAKKKNTRKKKPSQPQGRGAYKRFLEDVTQVYKRVNNNRFPFSTAQMRDMFQYNAGIKTPKAGNDLVSSKEMLAICEKSKHLYKDACYEYNGVPISAYETQLLFLIFKTIHDEFSRCFAQDDEKTIQAETAKRQALEQSINNIISNYLRMLSRMSCHDKKVFSIDVHFKPSPRPNKAMDIEFTIYATEISFTYIPINNIKRPIFRLGLSTASKDPYWETVPTTLLTGLYRGNRPELPVYMQSHALQRMKERLDLLDQPALNFTLWNSFPEDRTGFVYKNLYLTPVTIHNIRVGYFAGSIISNKMINRTFLFITHTATPEGDKLNELTGLGKGDIKYWRIDRLSTFMHLNKDEYPELLDLMTRAGMDDLGSLRDKAFDTDSLQTVNLSGLSDYITQGYHNFFANEYSTVNPELVAEHK